MLKKPLLTLLQIPEEKYSNYRYEVIFRAYKWDPQVKDSNTVSRHALLITPQTAQELSFLAEKLSLEVMDMEEALLTKLDLHRAMGFSGKIKRPLRSMESYRRGKNIRLMRFDFHPTDEGWRISEVNSDVPGGLAEASILPKVAGELFKNVEAGENVAEHLLKSFKDKLKRGSRIAFIHATSYADDRQVMQFLGDYFNQNGYRTLFAAPDHIQWQGKKAYSIIEGEEGAIDGLVRFFPLEWMTDLPHDSNWQGYFDCDLPCCSHPAAILTQSKRLPLVWDELNLDIPYWKELLPETKEPKAIPKGQENWIYKPAFGRVGSGISIKGAITEKERIKIEKAARRQKRLWVAQHMFNSIPVKAPDGKQFHACLGVFTVDGKAAGFYARLSETARIDENAQDVPVLISKGVTDVR
ncbi:MAG: glutathionylspermidine synthase family protein [Oscillospiraceae bacterium]|jgi:glutathionylspermidine synthase|nr:glutathionylspermidine synthase family protein [Oscillospiraceae bacterium]